MRTPRDVRQVLKTNTKTSLIVSDDEHREKPCQSAPVYNKNFAKVRFIFTTYLTTNLPSIGDPDVIVSIVPELCVHMTNRGAAHVQPAEPTDAETIIDRVRVAPFWHNEPTLWFTQLEAQFNTYGLTSDVAKYGWVLLKLGPETAREFADIPSDTPEKDRYETVKRDLIRRLSTTQHQRIQQLLHKRK